MLCNKRFVLSTQASSVITGRISRSIGILHGIVLKTASYNRRHVIHAYQGGYRITGSVTELGSPGAYRVRLFDRRTGMMVRETWSASTGEYAFNNITPTPNNTATNGYFVIAFDHGDNPLNAAIADLVTPEPMP